MAGCRNVRKFCPAGLRLKIFISVSVIELFLSLFPLILAVCYYPRSFGMVAISSHEKHFVRGIMGIYMAVVCVDPECERGRDLYAGWGRAFCDAFQPSQLHFFHAAPVTISEGHSHAVDVPSNWAWRGVFFLNYAAAHHLLETTLLPWFVRTSYDVWCHFGNFRKLMDNLTATFDPFRQVVIKGEAFLDHGDYTWIHGGPGWIMSRLAVEKFIEREEWMRRLNAQHFVGDDVMIAHFAHSLNLTFNDVFCGAFFGGPLIFPQILFLNSSFAMADIKMNCPSHGYWHPFIRARDVAFFHNGHKINWVNQFRDRLADEAPPDLFLEGWPGGGKFCWRK
jgi:hypothetical protein